jgi:uncharacterized protein YaaN involved in tellurite resistance
MNREQLEKIYDKIDEIRKIAEEGKGVSYQIEQRLNELEVAVKEELKTIVWTEYLAKRSGAVQ